MDKIESPYLRLGEAAEYVRFSVRQFKRFVERDHIPSRGPDGRLYCRDDLDAWVDNQAIFRVKKQPSRRIGQFTPVTI